MVAAVNVGVLRALATAFSKEGKKLPPLPSFDDVMRSSDQQEAGRLRTGRSPWQDKFERANPMGRGVLAEADDAGR